MGKKNTLYKLDDRVLLKEGSRWWLGNLDRDLNPRYTPGVVYKIEHHTYKVRWDNGHECAFQDEDLELLERRLELTKLQSNSLYA